MLHNKSEEFDIQLAFNQIVIRVLAKQASTPATYYIYYSKTMDLGRGGMLIDWDRVSSARPIGKIHSITADKYHFIWYGLSHVETNEKIEAMSDFSASNNIFKCQH